MQFLQRKIASIKHERSKSRAMEGGEPDPLKTTAGPGISWRETVIYALRHRSRGACAQYDETALQLAHEEHRSEIT